MLATNHSTTDLSDIHLLVKRRLAGLHLGREGARQGAEERSSLLSKLLFSRHSGGKGSITTSDTPPQSSSSTPIKAAPASLPSPIPHLSPRTIEIQRCQPSPTTRTTTKDPPTFPAPEDRIISQGGLPIPRASLFSFPYTSSFPSAFTAPPLTLRPVPQVFSRGSSRQTSVHVIEIHSSDVEAGLTELLDR